MEVLKIMSTNNKNIPDFLDRVYHARKDGIIIAFDESEALIRYDDQTEAWVRLKKLDLPNGRRIGLISTGNHYQA